MSAKIKFYVKRSRRTPFFKLNSNSDTFFFPFYVQDEFNSKFTYNKINFERVYSGNKTTTLKLLDWEQQMVPFSLETNSEIPFQNIDKNTVFKRKFNIGTFFIGKVLSLKIRNEFTKKYGFIHQKLIKSTSVYFNSEDKSLASFIWDEEKQVIKEENLYLFFMAPEIAGDDILKPISINIQLDLYGRFICAIVDFTSVTEEFKEKGKNIDSAIQFGAPGEIPILPCVNPSLIYNPKVPKILTKKEILFYEPNKQITFKNENNEDVTMDLYLISKGSKKAYIDVRYFERIKPIKNIQLKIKGEFGFGGIKIIGRKIYKNNKNEIVYGRSQNLFVHKLHEPVFNVFDKTKNFNNNFIIISGLEPIQQIWTDVQKLEKYYSNINPDIKRSSQIILKTDSTFDDIVPKNEDNEILNTFPISNSDEKFPLTSKNKLIGKNSIAYSKYSDFKLKDSDIISGENLIVYEKDFIDISKISPEEFINFNPFLIDNIQYLQIGQVLLSNNKGEAQSAVNTSLGLGADFIFKLTKKVFAFVRPNAIISTFFQWSPHSWFVGKKLLKLSSKVNLLFSREIIDFFGAELPKGRISNNFYIPLDFFLTGFRNQFSRFLAVDHINKFFNMELTEKAYLKKKNSDDIELVDTSALRKGTHFISLKPFKTASSSKDGFLIDAIEVTVLGQRILEFSFLDSENEISNYFRIKTQSLFTNNISEIKNTIQFSRLNENFSSKEEFIDTILNQNRKEAVELAYYYQQIQKYKENLAALATKAKKLEFLKSLLNSFAFNEIKYSYSILHSRDDRSYSRSLNENFAKSFDYSNAWNFIKKHIKYIGNEITIFDSITEAKEWLINQFKANLKVEVKIDLDVNTENYLRIQQKDFDENPKVREWSNRAGRYITKVEAPELKLTDSASVSISYLNEVPSSKWVRTSPFTQIKKNWNYPQTLTVQKTLPRNNFGLAFDFEPEDILIKRTFKLWKYYSPNVFYSPYSWSNFEGSGSEIVLKNGTISSSTIGSDIFLNKLNLFIEGFNVLFNENNGKFYVSFSLKRLNYAHSRGYEVETVNRMYHEFYINFNIKMDKKNG